MNQENNIELINNWVLWSHDIHDIHWNIESYTNLCTINTVSDFSRTK
jgi:hypothetical protein